MNPDCFEAAYFFIRIRRDAVLNCSGEQFKTDDLMSGFTGFVRTEGRFV